MHEKIDDDAINYLLRKKPKLTTTSKASDIIGLIDSLRKNQMSDTDRRKLELFDKLKNCVGDFECYSNEIDLGMFKDTDRLVLHVTVKEIREARMLLAKAAELEDK